MKRLSIVVLALQLLGCVGMPGVFWSDAKIDGKTLPGPLTAENKRLPLQTRCGTTGWLANGPTCAWAFLDADNRRIDMYDLRDRIDEFTAALPQFRDYAVKSQHQFSRLPYTLYLLTISPEVILAVPEGGKWMNCSRVIDQCLHSEKFQGHAYWYEDTAVKSAGSFWFSPSIPGRTFPINENLSEIMLDVGTAKLKLTASEGLWLISREQ